MESSVNGSHVATAVKTFGHTWGRRCSFLVISLENYLKEKFEGVLLPGNGTIDIDTIDRKSFQYS
jgi:hypothetical protein